jgi:hypothetical protein
MSTAWVPAITVTEPRRSPETTNDGPKAAALNVIAASASQV